MGRLQQRAWGAYGNALQGRAHKKNVKRDVERSLALAVNGVEPIGEDDVRWLAEFYAQGLKAYRTLRSTIAAEEIANRQRAEGRPLTDDEKARITVAVIGEPPPRPPVKKHRGGFVINSDFAHHVNDYFEFITELVVRAKQ